MKTAEEILLGSDGDDDQQIDNKQFIKHQAHSLELVEKITRERVFDSVYWKQYCSADNHLNAATIMDLVVKDVKQIGGLWSGSLRPTDFMCLIIKGLLLGVEKEILLVYITQPDFKYLRAYGALLLRLVTKHQQAQEMYALLDSLLLDHRKLRMRNQDGSFSLTHMDVFIDSVS